MYTSVGPDALFDFSPSCRVRAWQISTRCCMKTYPQCTASSSSNRPWRRSRALKGGEAGERRRKGEISVSKCVRGWSKLTVKEGQGLLPLESAL
mmetsp:Transcript_41754/g.131648  ORF Transcript_41754/g.131648 Transcript_41754/m.131648 type:complete len:94 (+) Transcript_41754:990-1271(+)